MYICVFPQPRLPLAPLSGNWDHRCPPYVVGLQACQVSTPWITPVSQMHILSANSQELKKKCRERRQQEKWEELKGEKETGGRAALASRSVPSGERGESCKLLFYNTPHYTPLTTTSGQSTECKLECLATSRTSPWHPPPARLRAITAEEWEDCRRQRWGREQTGLWTGKGSCACELRARDLCTRSRQ